MRRILIFVTLVLHLGACGQVQSQLNPVKDPASVFPEDIIYKPVGDCSDGTLSFVVMKAGGLMLWTDPADVVTAQMDLFIHQDLTFDARYREFEFNNQIFDQSIHSRFSIDWESGVIHFEGLGEGQVSKLDGRIYLNLTFTHTFNSQLLVGKIGRFRIIKSADGLGTDRVDYCGW